MLGAAVESAVLRRDCIVVLSGLALITALS
jgi:hypothetical protein